jgi:UDP-glucuronate decarboxylase
VLALTCVGSHNQEDKAEGRRVKILVTGGAGFLGSHLCDRLLLEGHEVLAVDNLYSGTEANISHLSKNSCFEFMKHDVTAPLNVEVDAIYNLACPASPVQYQKFPVETIKTSLLGAINMLELAKKRHIPILQASTSEVYGDPSVSPQAESYWGNVNPIGLRACYDEGKRAAESLFFDYHRQFGVDIKVARIFNTFGPRMSFSDGRVVSNFVYQALNDEDITVYGSGNQTRSFCYVTDLIDGLYRFMHNLIGVTGPVNLGNPTEVSMNEVATKIITLTGSKSKLVNSTLPPDDPKQRKPDITLAKALLSWSPKVSIEEGLNLTIDDFKARL